jgi:hypothetical protein
MQTIFDTILLLALPASGKSEVRQFLIERSPRDFHLGETVQLDDYPYVDLQLCIDEMLEDMGLPRVYHEANPVEGERNGPFFDPREFAGLIHLLNEDYLELRKGQAEIPNQPGKRLIERFDTASAKAGARTKFDALPPQVVAQLISQIDPLAQKLFAQKAQNCPASLEGKTIVIEFARGCPAYETTPPPHCGYSESLRHLAPELLRHASILYIQVRSDQSRQKNRERAIKDDHGSILHHGTPEIVMEREYAACDLQYLLESSDKPNYIRIVQAQEIFYLPTAIFDNRADLTTFARSNPQTWRESDIHKLQSGLKQTCDQLWDITIQKP